MKEELTRTRTERERPVESARSARNFIWIQTAFLGDIVLTTAGMRLAHEKFPRCRQFLITTKVGELALRGQRWLTDIIVLDKSTYNLPRTFREVKKKFARHRLQKADTVIVQPHMSLRSSLLARYLGFRTITFGDSTFSFLATSRVRRDTTKHITTRIASLLAPAGVDAEAIACAVPYLNATPASPSIPRELRDLKDKTVIVAAGSRWATKMWGVEKFRELITRILACSSCNVLVLGDKNDVPLSEVLAQPEYKDGGRYWDLIGKTSPADLCYLVPRSDLIVANDSALTHYGSAFNVPTITIFGSTVPAFGFTPLAEGSAIVETSEELGCRPCGAHGKMVCPRKHFRCMRAIGVEQVWENVAPRLK